MNGLIRTAVCHLLYDGDGKYAVHWRTAACRDEHECWDIGGGGIKFGEKVEDALHRELKEEYCTTPQHVEFMGWRDVFRTTNGKETHWITFDFKVQVDPQTVSLGEPEKARDLRWVTLDELHTLDPIHSQAPTFLEKNKEFLK